MTPSVPSCTNRIERKTCIINAQKVLRCDKRKEQDVQLMIWSFFSIVIVQFNKFALSLSSTNEKYIMKKC